MKKINVNIKDFYPTAEYSPYLQGGKPVPAPENPNFSPGDVVFDKENKSIGIVLGCIDENFDGSLRLDSDGMRPIENLRPARKLDFATAGITFSLKLKEVVLGLTNKFNPALETNEQFKERVYGNLNKLAKEIAKDVIKEINEKAPLIENDNMPYKGQYVLEQVIQILEKSV